MAHHRRCKKVNFVILQLRMEKVNLLIFFLHTKLHIIYKRCFFLLCICRHSWGTCCLFDQTLKQEEFVLLLKSKSLRAHKNDVIFHFISKSKSSLLILLPLLSRQGVIMYYYFVRAKQSLDKNASQIVPFDLFYFNLFIFYEVSITWRLIIKYQY